VHEPILAHSLATMTWPAYASRRHGARPTRGHHAHDMCGGVADGGWKAAASPREALVAKHGGPGIGDGGKMARCGGAQW
jgi:hypothetical protein